MRHSNQKRNCYRCRHLQTWHEDDEGQCKDFIPVRTNKPRVGDYERVPCRCTHFVDPATIARIRRETS